MNKTDKQILALQNAAKKQTDPVKRQAIFDKIRTITVRQRLLNWLAQ